MVTKSLFGFFTLAGFTLAGCSVGVSLSSPKKENEPSFRASHVSYGAHRGTRPPCFLETGTPVPRETQLVPGGATFFVAQTRYSDADGNTNWHRVEVYPPTPFPPPKGVHYPVVVFLHGGDFSPGETELRDEVPEIASSLAADGIVAITPNYTMVSGTPPPQPPAHLPIEKAATDAACATDWAAINSRYYGGDPAQVVLAGFSTGATIASLVAVDPTYLQSAGLSQDEVSGAFVVSGRYEADHVPRRYGGSPASELAWIDQYGYPPGLGEPQAAAYAPAALIAKYGVPPFAMEAAYAQCDSDTQYDDVVRIEEAFARRGASLPIFEETWSSARGFPATHGTEPLSLATSNNPHDLLHKELSNFIALRKPTNPTVATWEGPIPSASGIPVLAADVGTGEDGSTWVVNSVDGQVYKYSNEDNNSTCFSGPSGNPLPNHETAARIGVDSSGTPWVTTPSGNLYYLAPGLDGVELMGSWVLRTTGKLDIGTGGGDGSLWVTAKNTLVYAQVPPSRSFVEVPPVAASSIAVDQSGSPWAVGFAHDIVTKPGGVYGSDWSSPLPSPAPNVGASDIAAHRQPWIIGTDANIYVWTSDNWTRKPALLPAPRQIAVGMLELPWVSATDQTLWSRH